MFKRIVVLMNKKYVFATAILIGISVVINIVLYIQNRSLVMLNENYKISEKIYIEERIIINELIPKTDPFISKEDLAAALNSIIPGERVDILEDHIGWRFYHFWFSKDGRIINVTYGS